MRKRSSYLMIALAILLMVFSTAGTVHQPQLESNAYDLIAVINALRGAYGLPAYNVNSILMTTAQNQADYMALTETVTHFGSGDSTMTQRLLAAGYPLGGDLSAGGFRSENIIQLLQSGTAQDAVDAWMGDAPHQNTMLSQDLTEIGAGVAVMNGRVYYVIDCARPANGSEASASTHVPGVEATVPVAAAVIYPIEMSTPNANGEVIHEVRGGQTLWQIAISYGVKINDIKSRNNLLGNDIYPGYKLLIRIEATATALPSATSELPPATVSASPTATLTPTIATMAAQTLQTVTPQNTSRVTTVAFSIVALALVGGVIAWLLSSMQNPSS
jgi:uncharacterized protein YkwD/LysM repeat protein